MGVVILTVQFLVAYGPYDNVAEDRSLIKRKWPNSSEAGPSGVQSPVNNAPPTFKHSQPRPIVGSPANTLATEKRRKTKASFICDQCHKTFTRNHNLLSKSIILSMFRGRF